MAIGREQRSDSQQFFVRLPRTTHRLLCVEISSRDGRYEAKLEYPLGRADTGLVPLAFRPRHRTEIRDLGADELAILAHVGATCADEAETYVVASWEPAPTSDVTVFVNSRVPTYVIAVENGTVTRDVRCEDLEGTTTAFNLRCTVPRAWIKPGANFFVRKRERRGGTRIAIVDTPLPLRM